MDSSNAAANSEHLHADVGSGAGSSHVEPVNGGAGTASGVASGLAPEPAAGEVAAALQQTLAHLDEQLDAACTTLTSPGLSTSELDAVADAVRDVCLFADTAIARYSKVLASSADLAKRLQYSSPMPLLQHELGLKSRRAQDAVAVGKLLHGRRYPSLADAIDNGVVSLCQAAQVIQVIDDVAADYDPNYVAEAEAAITRFATGEAGMLPVKPEQLRRFPKSWFAQHAPEQTQDQHEAQWRKRSCTYAVRDDGMIHLTALLPTETGVAVIEYLDAHASPRVRFTDLHDPNPTPQDDGSGELLDTRTRGQKMADGLARAFHTAATSVDAPTQGGAAPVLTVTIPITELDRHARHEPALAELPRTGTAVPAHVAARAACDGIIQAAVMGRHGEVLYLGRTQRLFTAKQKQALALTYKQCAVGGCDIPGRWCEAHHVVPWSKGGTTDLSEGILVCNFHHHQIHQDNLVIERPPGSRVLQVRRRRQRHRHHDRTPGDSVS